MSHPIDYQTRLQQATIAGLTFQRRNLGDANTPEVIRKIYDRRNFYAVQAALHRGDKDPVTLLNRDDWDLKDPQTVELKRYALGDDLGKDQTWPFPRRNPPAFSPLDKSDEAYDRVQRLFEQRIPWQGFHLRQGPVIGRGGNGVVLAATAEFKDGRRRELAIKILKRVNEVALDAERRWHQIYGGATHVVQHVDLAALARENAKSGQDGTPFDERGLGVLVLERAEHGSLWDFMNSVARHKVTIPNKVLWSIWSCLIKMLASVDYQPESNASSGKDFEAFLQTSESNQSIATFLQSWTASHHVHFDNSLQNILVTADDGLHRGNPLFKIHDFDHHYSKDMRAAWDPQSGWNEVSFWSMREAPKNLFLPEQMTKEWDRLDPVEPNGKDKFVGEDLSTGEPVAGRFGSWSNVFFMGSIMELIMCGISQRHPFVPRPFPYSKQPPRSVQTYGWRVARARGADPALRSIVMRSQAERPADRPTVAELLDHARQFMPHDPTPDPEVANFYHQVFNTPAPDPPAASKGPKPPAAS